MPYIGTSPSNGVRQTYDYTATAGQTSFSGSDNNSQTLTYTDSAYIDVYQNGILLVPSDYTATTGTTVVLDTGATVSDTLQIVVYDVFSVADTVSASDGGSFGGNVGVGGTLSVTGATTLSGLTHPTSDGSNGQFLKTNGSGTLSFDTVTGTTINNNADNRIITGSGTANTLEGEANLTYNGSTLAVSGAVTATSFSGNGANLTNLPATTSFSTITVQGSSTPIATFYKTDTQSGSEVIRIRHQALPNATSDMISFRNNSNGETGGIRSSGSSASFYSGSDYRLKKDIVYDFNATDTIKQLRPCEYKWIDGPENKVIGFIAHEIQDHIPEMVSGTKDAMKDIEDVVCDADGNQIDCEVSEAEWTQGKTDGIYPKDSTWLATKNVPAMQTINESYLVPLLTKTIIELEARIKALESK